MKSDIIEVQNWLDTRLGPTLKNRMLSSVEIENMTHWLENYKDKSLIASFSVEKVLNSTKKWMHKLEESGRHVIEDTGDVKILKELVGGLYLVKLVSESAYKYEGFHMSHCAASYSNSSSDLYSIRDSFNKPHCTIEVASGSVKQIKGKRNMFVVSKYVPAVMEALQFLNVQPRGNDMKNLGLLEVKPEVLKKLNKICDIPVVEISGVKYINNADTFWHIL